MYNRYIPADADFLPIGEEPATPPEESEAVSPAEERQHSGSPGSSGPGGRKLPGGLSALLGKREGGGLSGLFRSIGLESIDTGDVLLLLIILYLLVEGDDLELVIALGLVLLMGLGEGKDSG